jgi:YesN/AraC family two-component response regulator
MHKVSNDDSGIRMLLVEDEEVARLTLGRMLTMKYPGAKIFTAENGRRGLELYRLHLPDLVISDINMPYLTGIEMARDIRREDQFAQVIFLTAHSEARQLMEAQSIGVPHYVLKPVDRNELFSAIARCLESRYPAGSPTSLPSPDALRRA